MKHRRDETKVSRAYTYRRDLGPTELVPAIGVGVAVGMAAFYVATLLLQRTPLVPGRLQHKERLDDSIRAGRSERVRELSKRA